MKKLVSLMVCIGLLLLASAALAAPVLHSIAADDLQSRLTITLPDGMSGDISYQNGKVGICINHAATNWSKVLSGEETGIQVELDAPAVNGKTLTHNTAFVGGLGYGDENAWIGIAEEGLSNSNVPDVFTSSESCGWLDLEKMVFMPEDGATRMVICWFDPENPDCFSSDSSVRYAANHYEQFIVNITHTSYTPVNGPALRYVTSEMLAPMKNVNGTSTRIEDGLLIINLPPMNDNEWFECALTVNMPENLNAAYATLTYGGRADVSDGKVVFDYFLACNSSQMVEELQSRLKWFDANGNELDYGILTTYVVPYESEVFPSYVTGWSAVPAERLHVSNSGKNCGITTQYDEAFGTLNISRDRTVVPNGDPGSVSVSVAAPDSSCRYYREISAGGSVIQGRGKENMVFDEMPYMPLQTVKDGKTETLFSCEPLERHKTGPMDVYLQKEETTLYGGGVFVIYWYDDPNGEPVAVEYVCQTIGELFHTDLPVDMVNNEQQIAEPVKTVTIVRPGMQAKELAGWQLVITEYPSTNDTAKHYELYLVNDTGAQQKLELPAGEKLVVYMPYPNSYAEDLDKDFAIYHYLESTFTLYEKLIPQKTENGLRFEVSTLSPFILDWDDEEAQQPPVPPAPSDSYTPPKTGDTTPMWALVACCLVSLAGWVMIMRRQRAR